MARPKKKKDEKEIEEIQQPEEPNKGGRPALFNNVDELQNKIQEYLNDCPDKRTYVTTIGKVDVPCPTITGLAYFLGFESRQSFYDYEQNDEFSYTIKRARLFIEKEYEKMLVGGNCTGAIFALKNFGWKDKTEQSINLNEYVKERIEFGE